MKLGVDKSEVEMSFNRVGVTLLDTSSTNCLFYIFFAIFNRDSISYQFSPGLFSWVFSINSGFSRCS